MYSCVIIIPPHDLKHTSRYYFRVQEDMKYSNGIITYNITSIQNFINSKLALFLLNSSKRIPVVKTLDKVKLGVDDHPQWRHYHSTSRIQASVTLVLPSAGSHKVLEWNTHLLHNVHTKSH
jgi:hypothetical protein